MICYSRLPKCYRLRLSCTWAALASASFAIMPVPASAQAPVAAPGEIVGRVSSASGDFFFEGASVTIVELKRAAVTGTGGRFTFSRVPAGNYTVRVSYLGAATVDQSVTVAGGQTVEVALAVGASEAAEAGGADILVEGQRANAASSANRKRNADRIVDSVSADFIGQFPDQNVTEAAQRIPGVSINRDQGEGRFISVRGADPNLNAVTINGVDVPSAESDARQVALDVIPSDLVQNLTVVKSLTPDLDANSIGGTVQIETPSAFDRDGFYATISGEAHYNELRDKFSPRFSGNLSNIFQAGGGEIGVLGSVSYFRRRLGSDGVENGDGLDEAGGVVFPVVIEPRDYVLTRERFGATLNVDWRVNPDFTLYVRQLYSRFSDDEIQGGTVFEADPDDGENIAEASGTRLLLSNQEVESYVSDRKEVQTVYSLSAGGENRFGAAFLEYQGFYSEAGEDNPDYLESIFVADFSDTDTLIGTDLADPRRPRIITSNLAGFSDPARYELDEIIFESSKTTDKRYGGRIDLTIDTPLGGGGSGFVKVGGKVQLREKTSGLDAAIFGGADQGLTVADFVNSRIDYPLGLIAPQAFPRQVGDAVRAAQALFDEDRDEEGSFIDSNVEDFQIDEDIYAGYAMAAAEFGDLRVVGGARVEHTESRSAGNEVTVDEENGDLLFSPIRTNRSYTDFLPSINARYRATDQLQFRAAYFRSVVRPNFEQARPAALLERDDEGEVEAEAGNPDLLPYRAHSFDLAAEFYPGRSSLLSAGLFYKRIANPIFPIDQAGTPGFEDFDAFNTFVNGDRAEIFGVEVALQQDLRFLPAPFDGLLIAANYTFVDTDADLPLPGGGTRSAPLPFQARHTANASIGYDKSGLQMRLSAAYRARILDEIGDPTDPEGDIFIDKHVQIDFTASYELIPGLRLFGQVSNLNDRPLYSYQGRRNVNVQYEEYGLSGSIGVRATLGGPR